MYCDVLDILLIYGKENVYQWADLDNNKIESDILDIIEFAIVDASEKIDSQFIDGPYALPLADSEAHIPETVRRWCARIAGSILYKARGYDGDDDPVIKVEKSVMKEIADVLAGLSRIKAVKVNYNRPMVGVLFDERTCE